MAFINDFKKSFKGMTDKTVKKTGELTAIAKLNVAIKTEESKLSDCYKSIGRLFYTAERDNLDNTEEIATYIMQADKIKAAIAGYQKELTVLRKVVVCEGCSNEISEECIFCPICGLKVTKPAPVVEEEAEEACECECEETAEECCCCEEQTDAADADAETCCCEETCECEAPAEEEKTEE